MDNHALRVALPFATTEFRGGISTHLEILPDGESMISKLIPRLSSSLMIFGGCAAVFNVYAATPDSFASDGITESNNYLSSSFQWENDIMFSDRWYTNGMKYSRTRESDCQEKEASALDKRIGEILSPTACQDGSKSILLVSPEIGMNMYTPKAISIATPQSNDRPWTGWLYYGQTWELNEIQETPVGKESYHYGVGAKKKLDVQVGGLGKWSQQDKIQRAWHSLIGAQQPMGWQNQSSGRLGLNLAYSYQKILTILI